MEAIEYDPNRTARIALLQYPDGEKTYILAPIGLEVGAKVIAGETSPQKWEMLCRLKSIPLGTAIHNVEIIPGSGGQWLGARGQQAILSNREGGYALVKYALGRNPAGFTRMLRDDWTGGQRRTYECFERESRAQSLAGPALALFAEWR